MVVGVSRKNARKIRFAAYCGAPSERASRPALLYWLKVDKKGRFSYSGRTDRLGGDGEPRVVKGGGDYDVKLKGQFVTRRKIELKITCDGKKTTGDAHPRRQRHRLRERLAGRQVAQAVRRPPRGSLRAGGGVGEPDESRRRQAAKRSDAVCHERIQVAHSRGADERRGRGHGRAPHARGGRDSRRPRL